MVKVTIDILNSCRPDKITSRIIILEPTRSTKYISKLILIPAELKTVAYHIL